MEANTVKKKIYLANSYGFSSQCKTLLPSIIEKLESLGLEVWEPFQRSSQIQYEHKRQYAYEIGQKDFDDVKNCDAIFAIVNGNPPDEGVMVELGMAIALNKKTFLFRDDFRKCCDSEEYPLNLMLFTGLPLDGWQDYYYTSIDEIKSADKALVKWISGGEFHV
jgi:nucleoside 2-deoxyribosyltransferase